MLNVLTLYGRALLLTHVHAQVRERMGADKREVAWVAELEAAGAARMKQWGIDMRQTAAVR
jgi:hypothetical protein